MSTPLAGLIVSIMRDSRLGDCTNDGVTSPWKGHRDVLLVGPGIPEIHPDRGSRPVLKLVKRMLGGKPYFHAEPIDPSPAGEIGWMAGGNFAYSPDSRFNDATAGYPISIHDRKETVEQYRMLST